MIEQDVGYTLDGTVPGHGNNRHRKRMLQSGIDGNKSFSSAPQEHLTVFFDQILSMPMVRGEIKISRIHQLISDSAHHLGVISVAKFRYQDSDRRSSPVAQRAREKAGLVIQFLRCGLNAVARRLGDGSSRNIS